FSGETSCVPWYVGFRAAPGFECWLTPGRWLPDPSENARLLPCPAPLGVACYETGCSAVPNRRSNLRCCGRTSARATENAFDPGALAATPVGRQCPGLSASPAARAIPAGASRAT